MKNENKTLTKKIDLKSFIVPTKLENTDEEQKYGDSSFDTKDLIYLESWLDVENIPKDERIVYPTDYAVMNGCYTSFGKYGLLNKESCATWLRSDISTGLVNVVNFNGENNGMLVNWLELTTICPTLRLDLSAVISARRLSQDVFKINDVVNKNGKVLYHTIEFGEYPKTYVGETKNKELENLYSEKKLVNTSKTYTGRYIEDDGELALYPEFEHEGQRYVRVINEKYNNASQFSDGTMSPKSGTPLWVKVEPITWKIKNWEDMPWSINPQGNGSTNFIDVRAEYGIMSGIPFYTNTNDENCSMWQNSIIRARLNGYNTHKEIAKGNGNSKYIAEKNFNFTKNNFLNEAFSNVLTLTKQTNVKTIKRKGYGVRIADKSLSVDEQIKFYIEKRKSFMLHGPSGVGKTRRIEEADPEFVSIVLRNGILPEEVIGKTIYLSDDKTKAGKWVAPAWYQDLCEKCAREPNKNHVLFIDEITNVKPSEQSLVFHLVLNHSIGPNLGKLPDNVVVVAAGNSIEESESAYNMPEPLFRRFDAHIYLKPDIQEWLEWGSEKKKNSDQLKIHPLVANFVAANREKVFYSPYDSEEPPKYAVDPRGWEQVSDIIYDNDGFLAKELVENKVGKEIAAAFIEFARTIPLEIEDVMDDNFDIDEIPNNFDAKYALAMSLRYADFEQIDKVRKFVGKYLGGEILAMYDSVWAGKDDDKAIFLERLKYNKAKTFAQ